MAIESRGWEVSSFIAFVLMLMFVSFSLGWLNIWIQLDRIATSLERKEKEDGK